MKTLFSSLMLLSLSVYALGQRDLSVIETTPENARNEAQYEEVNWIKANTVQADESTGNRVAAATAATIAPLIIDVATTDTARIYVTYLGAGAYNGSSWDNALPADRLQDALDFFIANNPYPTYYREVWLGLGVNLPVALAGVASFAPSKRSPFVSDDSDPRARSFVIPAGVNLFGSFYGNETSRLQRTAVRSIRTNLNGYMPTVVGDPTSAYVWAYQIVVFGDGVNPLSAPSQVNEVTVVNGMADHDNTNANLRKGGGVVAVGNSTISNCIIANTFAATYAGGVWLRGANTWLTSSLIEGCSAGEGSAVYMEAGTGTTDAQRPHMIANTIANCGTSWSSNSVVVYNNYAHIQSTVLWGNSSNDFSATGVNNSTLSFNTIAVDASVASLPGTGHIQLSTNNTGSTSGTYYPRFKNPTAPRPFVDGAYELQATSDLINKGSVYTDAQLDAAHMRTIDMLANPRSNGALDIGCYEYRTPVVITPQTVSSTVKRLYISVYPHGTRNGSSWANATDDLQGALDYFSAQTLPSGGRFEIWISGGVYKPTALQAANSESVSFVLNEKTDVYGGFKGVETALADRPMDDQNGNGIIEDWEFQYPVTLIGQVIKVYSYMTRSTRIVTYAPASATLVPRLEGVNIAYAQGSSTMITGNGLYATAPIKVTNSIFYANSAYNTTGAYGAAFYSTGNGTVLFNSVIYNNQANTTVSASTAVSAVYVKQGSVVGNIFYKNALRALQLDNSTAVNNTIVSNTSGMQSLGVPNLIFNNILWGNGGTETVSISTGSGFVKNAIQSTTPITGNIILGSTNATGAKFVNPTTTDNANFTLQDGSPCINAGIDQAPLFAVIGITKDLYNNTRINAGTVDIGAVEYIAKRLIFLNTTLDRKWENPANWNLGVIPTVDNVAWIQGDALVDVSSGVAICDSLVIFPTLNGKVTVNPLAQLRVRTGILDKGNNVENLYVKSSDLGNGSLIFGGTPPLASVELYTKGFRSNVDNKLRWQFIGIPVDSVKANPTFYLSYMYQWFETMSPTYWKNMTNDDYVKATKGYALSQAAPKTVLIQGKLINTSKFIPLTYSAGVYQGFNLVSNPYLAAIDISDMTFVNAEQAVYVFNTGSYAEWQADSVANTQQGEYPGQYTVIPVNQVPPSVQREIPSMQAFFVRATNAGTVQLVYDSVAPNTKPLRAPAVDNREYVQIDVTNRAIGDRMWIFRDQNATRGYDDGYDGRKYMGETEVPQLFAIEADGYYGINTVDNIEGTVIGFLPGTRSSSYDLTIKGVNLLMDNNQYQLRDVKTNAVVLIGLQPQVLHFEATNSDVEPRFVIERVPGGTTDDPTAEQGNWVVFGHQNELIVANPTAETVLATLFDVTGKEIQELKLLSGTNVYSVGLSSGNYIVKILDRSYAIQIK